MKKVFKSIFFLSAIWTTAQLAASAAGEKTLQLFNPAQTASQWNALTTQLIQLNCFFSANPQSAKEIIEVQSYKPAHYKAVQTIIFEAYNSNYNAQQMANLINGNQIYVVLVMNECVGFIAFKNDKDYTAIHNLAVKKEFQKKGIGSKLVDHVIALLKSQNCPQIQVLPLTASVPFYVKKGFKSNSQDSCYYSYMFK